MSNHPASPHAPLTFALHALAEEALEQALAVLADGGTGVGVDGEGVRHLDPAQHHLLHPDGPAAPGEDPLPGLLMGPLLRGTKKRKKKETLGRIKNHMQEGREREPQREERKRERSQWERDGGMERGKEMCHTVRA